MRRKVEKLREAKARAWRRVLTIVSMLISGTSNTPAPKAGLLPHVPVVLLFVVHVRVRVECGLLSETVPRAQQGSAWSWQGGICSASFSQQTGFGKTFRQHLRGRMCRRLLHIQCCRTSCRKNKCIEMPCSLSRLDTPTLCWLTQLPNRHARGRLRRCHGKRMLGV